MKKMLKRVYVSFVFVFIFLVLGVSLIVAQDTGANEGIIDNDATDIDTQTCNAFFSGYVYYSDANACKLEETSGCDNPYDYSTREECESANGINSEDKDDFNGRDKDKVFRDLEGCGNNCKKVCNDEECRSRCIGKCKSEYGFDKIQDIENNDEMKEYIKRLCKEKKPELFYSEESLEKMALLFSGDDGKKAIAQSWRKLNKFINSEQLGVKESRP